MEVGRTAAVAVEVEHTAAAAEEEEAVVVVVAEVEGRTVAAGEEAVAVAGEEAVAVAEEEHMVAAAVAAAEDLRVVETALKLRKRLQTWLGASQVVPEVVRPVP